MIQLPCFECVCFTTRKDTSGKSTLSKRSCLPAILPSACRKTEDFHCSTERTLNPQPVHSMRTESQLHWTAFVWIYALELYIQVQGMQQHRKYDEDLFRLYSRGAQCFASMIRTHHRKMTDHERAKFIKELRFCMAHLKRPIKELL